jgi:hypothetical protein
MLTCLKTENDHRRPVDANQLLSRGLAYNLASTAREKPMRFYFDISDRLPIRDQVGRDFWLASEAIAYAKYLAADLRCLEPDISPGLSIRVIGEDLEPIHEEAVFT